MFLKKLLPAVDQQSLALPAKDGHKLVHDAAGNPGVSMFRLLAGYCFGYFVFVICKNITHKIYKRRKKYLYL